MNRFFTLLFAAFCLTAVGQTEYPYPYNPDGNNDGYISLNDLLDLLSVYGSEFNAGVLATDSLSAIFYTGEMDYWDCASSCVGLKGNWKVLDHHLIGSYREVLSETEDISCWLDHTQFNSLAVSATFPVLYPSAASVSVLYPNDASVRCFCQTRTRADIEDINVCEGLEDECGVCNGDGAIYECGCSDIPEGDCDCEGNQLDAIGVCGGDCLEDADGDGVCDPVLGPCEGQDFVTYHGYDYEIVETADGRCWFAENLRTTKYKDGSDITAITEWAGADGQSMANLGCDPSYPQFSCALCCANAFVIDLANYSAPVDDWNSNFFGTMEDEFNSSIEYSPCVYNGVVAAIHEVCPQGWHVPSEEEYRSLVDDNLLQLTQQNALGQRLALLDEEQILNEPYNSPSVSWTVYPTIDYDIHDLHFQGYNTGVGHNGALTFYSHYSTFIWTSSFENSLEGSVRAINLNWLSSSSELFENKQGYERYFPIRCIKDSE